jgi:hypothetical protein
MMSSLCVRERFFLIKLAHPWALVCPHSFYTCNVIYTGRLLDKIPFNWGNYDLVDMLGRTENDVDFSGDRGGDQKS